MNYVNILAQFSKADELREVWHSIKLNKKIKCEKVKKKNFMLIENSIHE